MLVSVCFTAACSVDSTQNESVGQVKMNLTGTSIEGNIYRLRAATFSISGPTAVVLDTETDPDLTVLSADLPVGDYTSTLTGPWYLERADGMGAFTPVAATLISENPLPFAILPSTATDVVYQFATDGTVVTIGDGSVNISIDVIEQAGGNCTVLDPATCPSGQSCAILDFGSPDGICAAVGPGTQGTPCAAVTDCAADHVCADAGSGTICIELCALADVGQICSDGVTTCLDAVGSSFIGVCF